MLKSLLIVLAVAAIAVFGVMLTRDRSDLAQTDPRTGSPAPVDADQGSNPATEGLAAYADAGLGFEFAYKTGPDGYVLEEMKPASEPGSPLQTLVLLPTRDKERLLREGAPMGGEGPATLTINIFDNAMKRQPGVWAMEQSAYSNYGLKRGEVTETVVGGANAVAYAADGLYPSTNVVVAHGSKIYLFTGMVPDETSSLRTDFLALLETVKFPAPAAQDGSEAKIDIGQACQSALAYMTFADGKSADAFVQDCQAGKHPEVIDRYKTDMGLGAGASL